MMPFTLFEAVSYPSQNQKASFKYAENISKQIQPHDIDAVIPTSSKRSYTILKIQIMQFRSVLGCPGGNLTGLSQFLECNK